MHIDQFEMERMQSIHWHGVDYDLSESGVSPLTIAELLGEGIVSREFMATRLAYPLSEGSMLTRERIAAWYPGATAENVTVVNGGSEANHLSLWTLLEPGDRLAFMVPNYMQGWGLGRHYSEGTDVFHLRLANDRWALDLDELERAVTEKTRVVMVCNPNNPTGHVFTEEEISAIVAAASRVGAWLVADEVYRGAEVGTDQTSPTFWGRYDKVIVTAGLSKAFAMPGLRVGWAVAPTEVIQMGTHRDIFRYVPPKAGGIAFVEYDLAIDSTELIDRIRRERSVLLVPGDTLGVGRGIRFGYGYDIEHTLAGLARVDEVLGEIER